MPSPLPGESVLHQDTQQVTLGGIGFGPREKPSNIDSTEAPTAKPTRYCIEAPSPACCPIPAPAAMLPPCGILIQHGQPIPEVSRRSLRSRAAWWNHRPLTPEEVRRWTSLYELGQAVDDRIQVLWPFPRQQTVGTQREQTPPRDASPITTRPPPRSQLPGRN